jgi:hypothetical protein
MSTESEPGKTLAGLFDFYDYAGFMVPGAVLLLGFSYLIPQDIMSKVPKDISFGAFGLLALSAYVAGHLVEGLAEVLDDLLYFRSGRSTDWTEWKDVLPENQVNLAREKAEKRFNYVFDDKKIKMS